MASHKDLKSQKPPLSFMRFIKNGNTSYFYSETKSKVMNDNATKDDLRQFGLLLIDQIKQLMHENKQANIDSIDPEWIKSHVVKKLMDMSAASLQNLRISRKIRFKKVLGSYYYNKSDLMNLFKDVK
jgi:hypothetical protein